MISTDFATKHILLKVGNEVAMIAVSAENRTAFSAQWVGEEVFTSSRKKWKYTR